MTNSEKLERLQAVLDSARETTSFSVGDVNSLGEVFSHIFTLFASSLDMSEVGFKNLLEAGQIKGDRAVKLIRELFDIEMTLTNGSDVSRNIKMYAWEQKVKREG